MNFSNDHRGPDGFMSDILNSMTDGLVVLSSDLKILHANQPIRDRFPDKLPLEGKSCFAALHDRSEPCDDCPGIRALASGREEKSGIRLADRQGTECLEELSAWPIVDADGEVTAVVETIRDVTVREEAESLRQEQEELYRSLFENNISPILLIDPEAGSIRDANPRACAFYGLSREQLRAMKITEINVLSEEEVFEEMERAKDEKRNYFLFTHRLGDGTTRDVEVFSGPITVRGKQLLCSVVHDVSERRAADREREALITELQAALSRVKTLQGLIPICSSCHKIRDDEGYWNRIEVYIKDHSEAEVTHGLCPECVARLYPDLEEN